MKIIRAYIKWLTSDPVNSAAAKFKAGISAAALFGLVEIAHFLIKGGWL